MHTGTTGFWKTLDEVGLTSGQLEPSDISVYSNLESDLPISAKPTAAMTTKSQRGH